MKEILRSQFGDLILGQHESNGNIVLLGSTTEPGKPSFKYTPFIDNNMLWLHIENIGAVCIDNISNCLSATAYDDNIAYIVKPYEKKQYKINFNDIPFTLSSHIKKLMEHASFGQSLSVGGAAFDLLTNYAPMPGRIVMAPAGVRVLGTGHGHIDMVIPVPPENIRGFIDAKETQYGSAAETGWVRGAEKFLNEIDDPNIALSIGCYGTSATNIQDLTNQEPARNLLRTVAMRHMLCTLNNVEYSVPFIDFVHGEANYAERPANYISMTNNCFSMIKNNISKITKGNTIVVLDQLTTWTHMGIAAPTCNMPLAQLGLALNYPNDYIMVGPKQDGTYRDNVHRTSESYQYDAEKRAWAKSRVHKYGIANGWPTFYPSHYTVSNNLVKIYVKGLLGNLELDSNIVMPENHGIHFVGINPSEVGNITLGSNCIFAEVSNTQFTHIRIALTGNPELPNGPETGPRHPFVDSVSTIAHDGTLLRRIMCFNEIYKEEL